MPFASTPRCWSWLRIIASNRVRSPSLAAMRSGVGHIASCGLRGTLVCHCGLAWSADRGLHELTLVNGQIQAMMAAVNLALKQALASPLMDRGDAHVQLLCQL